MRETFPLFSRGGYMESIEYVLGKIQRQAKEQAANIDTIEVLLEKLIALEIESED